MREKVKNILFILIIGSVCTLMLLGMRGHTYPIIAKYEKRQLKVSILQAGEVAYTAENFEEVFRKNIRTMEKKDFAYYLTPENVNIFEFEGRGLWGPIKGLVALGPDLKTLESITIIAQEETPGLGGRISETKFLDQFRKKKLTPRLTIAMRRKASRSDEVDAITGATMTSAALIDMINEAVVAFRTRLEGKE